MDNVTWHNMTCNSNIAQNFLINIDGKYKEFKKIRSS